MRVRILRKRSPFDDQYWEGFLYDGPRDATVAALIDYINYNDDIVNDKGEKTSRISWECSCLQAVCGSCAMVINCSIPRQNVLSAAFALKYVPTTRPA